MKKRFLIRGLTICLLFASLFFLGYSQDAANTGEEAKKAGNLSDTGTLEIQDIIIDDFEDAGSWQGQMPRDLGIIKIQAREGGAGELVKADAEKNKFVLGAKIAYFKTGPSWFSIYPPREIQIKGITKSLSVWVAGRNFSHVLKAIIRDYNGNLRYTSFGRLAFPGWQQLTAQIPLNVVQENYKLFSTDRPRGIRFVSFLVECAMDETVGEYYCYLDNLSAMSDMFLDNPENQDAHDPRDTW